MQALPRALVLVGAALWVASPVSPLWAETALQTNGTDTFIAASPGMPDLQAPGDVFASGGAVVTKGRVAGDAHVAGFDLDLEADVAGDLYAAGATVTVRAPVGGDLSMMGFSLRTTDTAITAGNARMLGSTITIDGPIGGALAATGAEITLNAAITGDALLQGGTLTFGPKARISGTLTYFAPEPVAIPAEVIAAAKVVYHKTPPMADRFEGMPDWGADWRGDWVEDWAGSDMPALPGTLALVSAFLVTLGFLILLGGVMLAMAPRWVEALRQVAAPRLALMVLLGVLGVAALLGLVPVAVMTVIGLPVVPIVVPAIVVVWTLGYVFGAYVVALRLYQAFDARVEPGLGLRIVLLGCGVLGVSLLNFVPLLGWMINLVLVLFGIGAPSTGVLRGLAAHIPNGLAVTEAPLPGAAG